WGSNQLSGPVNAGSAQWTTQNFAIRTGVMINSVVPNSGPTAGGTLVVITGWGFTGATNVSFGAAVPAIFSVNSDSQITATSQALALGGNVAPGGSATVSFTMTAPLGSTVVEALMIKEHQFWFDTVTTSPQQWWFLPITLPQPIWSATIDMSQVPTTWAQGVTQTISVKVTNSGNVTWPSTGTNEVDFDLHFTTTAGGSAQQAHWLNSTAFSLPGDLAPNASVTLTVPFASPGNGSLLLEALMIKEHQFWFDQRTNSPQQWAFIAVSVS